MKHAFVSSLVGGFFDIEALVAWWPHSGAGNDSDDNGSYLLKALL